MNRFAKYSWGVLAWNVLVILWGAIVRATGSGAGCGNHWPSCNGLIIPTVQRIQTVIEFTHRMMSGLALISVLILLIWGLRKFPKGSYQRIGVVGSAVFILLEALLGAGLVLFNLVEQNSSVFRAIAISSHLLNTFLLLAFLSINAWWASGGQQIIIKNQGSKLASITIGLFGVIIVGMSGAITALGDTLFPSTSLAQTFSDQSAPGAHFLVQLRIYHPLIAIFVGIYSLYLIQSLFFKFKTKVGKRLSLLVGFLIIVQWSAGISNVILLAPVWMQVVHLFLADTVWISFMLLAGHTFSRPHLETS
ncbi:MAG: COX15/CtaA family protein [Chloroflexi bacterium]|nr:COX15/CtaA family protein [Chloroflexota bacterium]